MLENSFAYLVAALVMLASGSAQTVEQWDVYELSLNGPSEGNPFLNVNLDATFSQGGQTSKVAGFYDGEGVYRVRFMPDSPGIWRYRTHSSDAQLDGKQGAVTASQPSPTNHGPVKVNHTFHFSYADGTPYKPLGTTCYAWTHRSPALEEKTLESLAASPFNKIRMCVFPKRYTWNQTEPPRYPFAGKPPRSWDFARFFQHLEKRITELRDFGIEADVILFHPYGKGHWGFDRMTPAEDDRYLRYIISRLAAYRNVWWSLANEYDFMTEKSGADWDRLFHFIQSTHPHQRLRSIHNGFRIYNHNQPWATHASIQNGSAVESAAQAVLYRDVYRKPILFDEVKCEGDIPRRWGNISAREMVHRFWAGTIAGTYVTHGETYLRDDDILWWSKGGVLKGESPGRLAFLKQILKDSPANGINPIDKWQNPEYAGQAPDFYLVYMGKQRQSSWPFVLPKADLKDGYRYRVELLDTWDMTTTPVDGEFVIKEKSNYFY